MVLREEGAQLKAAQSELVKHVAHVGSDAFSTDKREGSVWKTEV